MVHRVGGDGRGPEGLLVPDRQSRHVGRRIQGFVTHLQSADQEQVVLSVSSSSSPLTLALQSYLASKAKQPVFGL